MPHFGEPTPEGPGKRRFCRITTGTYAGDGAATQQITGIGFRPKFVMIYVHAITTLQCGWKSDQDGLNSMYENFVGMAKMWMPDHIISLDADGFTVGDGTGDVNGNLFNLAPIPYTYIAWG